MLIELDVAPRVAEVTIDTPAATIGDITSEHPVALVISPGPPGQPGPPGDGNPVIGETLTGADGTTTTFTTTHPFRTDTTAVYLNGLREHHYTETGPDEITLEDPPSTDDTLTIDYVREG